MADSDGQAGFTTITVTFEFPDDHCTQENMLLLLLDYSKKTGPPTHPSRTTLIAGSTQCSFDKIPDGTYKLIFDLPDKLKSWRIYNNGVYNEFGLIEVNSTKSTSVDLRFEIRPPYTSVQFVPYYLYTGSRMGIDPDGKPILAPMMGRTDDFLKYIKEIMANTETAVNNISLQKADLDLRCEIMRYAIQSAYQAIEPNSESDSHPDTLKIFMAPEFFFRGAGGGYELEWIFEVTNTLKAELNRSRYSNWLFILGTFEGFEIDNRVDTRDGHPTVDIYNTAIAYKGGSSIPHKMDSWSGDKVNYLVKEVVAFNDLERKKSKEDRKSWDVVLEGKSFELHIDANGDVPAIDRQDPAHQLNSLYFAPVGTEWCVRGIQGGSLFRIDNLTFGLEICADHGRLRLKNYFTHNAQKGEPKPQIQLIPSASIDISYNACVSDLVINVDAQHCCLFYPFYPSEPKYGIPTDVSAIPLVINDHNKVFDTRQVIEKPSGFDKEISKTPQCGDSTLDTSREICSNYGYIVVYESVQIPDQTYQD